MYFLRFIVVILIACAETGPVPDASSVPNESSVSYSTLHSLAVNTTPPPPFLQSLSSVLHAPAKRGLVSESSPSVVKHFDTMEQMLVSNYFLNPNRPKNVLVQISDKPSYYQVLSHLKNSRKIAIREILFGEAREASLLNQPITKCVFSHSEDAEVSISKTTSFALSFALLHGVLVSHSYDFELLSGFLIGLGLLVEQTFGIVIGNYTIAWSISMSKTKEISVSHSFGGSANCGSGKGGAAQLFTNIRYHYYPDAKVRYHFYDIPVEPVGRVPAYVASNQWGPAYSSLEYMEYGIVMYDNTQGTEYACVNEEESLRCDDVLAVRVFDEAYDPVEGLKYALSKNG